MSKKKLIILGIVFVFVLKCVQCFPFFCSQALVYMIKKEDIQSVSRILSLGVNPNIATTKNSWLLALVEKGPEFPLIEACNTGNVSIVRLLLQYGASTDPASYPGYNPFDAYLTRYDPDDVEMTRVLLESGVPCNWPSAYYGEPIMRAAGMSVENGIYDAENTEGIICIVEMLLNGRSIEEVDKQYGYTALMKAAFVGNLRLVEWLIERGADVDAKDGIGETALDYATRGGSQYSKEMETYLISVMSDEEQIY